MTKLRFINAHIGRWLFPLLVLAAGFTRHGGGVWHQSLGAAAVLVAGFRILEGFVGLPEARFSTVLRGTRAIVANVRSVIRGKDGFAHKNLPLRGLFLSVILSTTLVTGLSGAFLMSSRFWSAGWLQLLHALAAFLLFVSSALYGSIYFLARPGKSRI